MRLILNMGKPIKIIDVINNFSKENKKKDYLKIINLNKRMVLTRFIELAKKGK